MTTDKQMQAFALALKLPPVTEEFLRELEARFLVPVTPAHDGSDLA